ncbi:MAG: hypothetical protein K0S22_89 [Oscillospiraceae bacterium]|jgi:hypothetical protein|nr:hypothetical protein [Oscillospiraceae bacterium]
MNNKPEWMNNQQVKAYFDGLPPAVQENIMQASLPFGTLDEIERFAQNIRNDQNLSESRDTAQVQRFQSSR